MAVMAQIPIVAVPAPVTVLVFVADSVLVLAIISVIVAESVSVSVSVFEVVQIVSGSISLLAPIGSLPTAEGQTEVEKDIEMAHIALESD